MRYKITAKLCNRKLVFYRHTKTIIEAMKVGEQDATDLFLTFGSQRMWIDRHMSLDVVEVPGEKCVEDDEIKLIEQIEGRNK